MTELINYSTKRVTTLSGHPTWPTEVIFSLFFSVLVVAFIICLLK